MAIHSAHLVLVVTPGGQIRGIGIFSEPHPTILHARTFSLLETYAPSYAAAREQAEEELRRKCYAFGGELRSADSGSARGIYRSFGAL
jgi:hypothetical protein